MGLEKTVGYSSHKFLVFVSTADDSCQTPTDVFFYFLMGLEISCGVLVK